MRVLGARSRRPSLAIVLVVFGLCVLSLIPSIECLFKLVKKKKFMEGFLVGFLVGNEYALHKSPSKGEQFHGMPQMPSLSGMDYRSMSSSPNYLDHHHLKKFDRSYRIKSPRFIKHRSKKSRIKSMLKFPVYIRKSH